MRDCQVTGIGVWDTVGAIGLPKTDSDKDAYGEHYYHRITLPKNIAHAYHAVSIDDERREFAPVLFNRSALSKNKPGQNIDEVWFPGMHSDVGGGYKVTNKDPDAKALSNISLNWMADSFAAELVFDRSQFAQGNPLGPMHDSLQGLSDVVYRKKTRTIRKGARLHRSTLRRLKGPLEQPSSTREMNGKYEPVNLKGKDLSQLYEIVL